MLTGLGIIPEELEVDVGNMNLANLHHYPFLAGETPALASAQFPSQDNILIPEPTSPNQSMASTKAILAIDSEPESFETTQTTSSDTLSSMAETEVLEDDIGEVRMAHTQSVEIKRGVLVSVANSIVSVPQFIVSTPSVRSSMSHLAMSPSNSGSIEHPDFLSPHYMPSDSSFSLSTGPSSDTITNFPSPPPMLSPIMTSTFTLTAEIEKGLGSKVLDYRRSDLFGSSGMAPTTSRENQLRALAEALDFDQPMRY